MSPVVAAEERRLRSIAKKSKSLNPRFNRKTAISGFSTAAPPIAASFLGSDYRKGECLQPDR
jgi:hypothetical protein